MLGMLLDSLRGKLMSTLNPPEFFASSSTDVDKFSVE